MVTQQHTWSNHDDSSQSSDDFKIETAKTFEMLPSIKPLFQDTSHAYYLDIEDPAMQTLYTGNFSKLSADQMEWVQQRFNKNEQIEREKQRGPDFQRIVNERKYLPQQNYQAAEEQQEMLLYNKLMADDDEEVAKKSKQVQKCVSDATLNRDILSQQKDFMKNKFGARMIDELVRR